MNKNESKGFDDTNIDNDFKPSKNKVVSDKPKFLEEKSIITRETNIKKVQKKSRKKN